MPRFPSHGRPSREERKMAIDLVIKEANLAGNQLKEMG